MSPQGAAGFAVFGLLVGAYGTHEEARRVWKAKAQSTVDNALMRYFIIHAHKLLDPSLDKKA